MLLELAYWIWSLCELVSVTTLRVYYYFVTQSELENGEIIPQSALRDLRIPKHLALAYSNEANDLDLRSIARFLIWCKQLNIPHITLYDEMGRLKDLQKELIKQCELESSNTKCNRNEDSENVQNVTILSRLDGRQKFAEDLEDLVTMQADRIDIDIASKKLAWAVDPDLMIIFGYPTCVHGFPPWQLRLTEFINLRTHKLLPQKVFLNCLRRYKRISQREGI